MYTDELWQSYVELESRNYKIVTGKHQYEKKGYTHFDRRFWFPDRKEELKSLLQGNLRYFKKEIGRTEYWSFSPFLKLIVQTPRYRYEEEEKEYSLQYKMRPICYASHFDSLIFGFYAHCLSKVYERYIIEKGFDKCVLAYRSDLGLCNIQFSKEVFEIIRQWGTCTAIALDIKGYFDNISHKLLKEKWIKVLGKKLPEDQFRIFKALTVYSYVNKTSFYKSFRGKKKRNDREPASLIQLIPAAKDYQKFNMLRERKLVVRNLSDKGIPQGSAMSALLSNILLIDYDEMMYEKSKAEGFIYRRYCDDILIICNTESATQLQSFGIEKIAKDYQLKIQPSKVEIIDFHPNSKKVIRAFKRDAKEVSVPAKTNPANEQRFYKSLQYLGFEFNGQDIFIRSSSLSRYFRKMKARIDKTVSMAYSPRSKSGKIFKKQLFQKYSHLGKRNFLSYAYKAAGEWYINSKGERKSGMNSPAIRKQLSRHFSLMLNRLSKKNLQLLELKKIKNKSIIKRVI